MTINALADKSTNIILSIYGYVIGISLFSIFINYNVYIENNIRFFLDNSLAILNLIIAIIFIITLKKVNLKNINIGSYIYSSKNILAYILVSFLFLIGIFIFFFISEKSIYKYTPYSLGITFIFQSILLLYFIIRK